MKSEKLQVKILHFFQKNWPLFFIVLLWFAFSSPYFVKGKVPFASTYQATAFSPQSAYPHNGMPVKNDAMPDVIGQIYPWRYLALYIWKSGEIPLWNPYSFAGTPLLANYQSAVLFPLNILFFIMPFVDGWSWLVLLQPLLAGFFTYFYGRRLQLSKQGSLASAISFMFCGFIVTWMGYATLAFALLFLPLGLYAIESCFTTNKFRFFLLLSCVVPLSFFSGHFQISIYVFVTLFAYLVTRSLQTKRWKSGIRILFSLCIGILLSLPQLLPSFEFYTQSLRSGLYQKVEVIPWQYLATFFAPDFFGNPVTKNDWFGHYAEWNGYIGVLGIFLAMFALMQWRKPAVRFFAVCGFIALLLAFPTPLQDSIVFLHAPVLATSALSRVISIYCLAFAMLAGFGLDSLQETVHKKDKKTFIYWLVTPSIIFLILWGIVIGKLWIPLDKAAVTKQNLILPTLIMLAGFGVTIGAFLSAKRYSKWVLCIGVLVLVSIDMFRFATKWQPFDPKELVFQQEGVSAELHAISGYNRVLGSYWAEVSNYYRLPSLEGYDALYPSRYGEFIASLNDGHIQESGRSVVSFPRNGKYTSQALNLLNITYIVHKVSDDNKLWTFPYWLYPSDQFVPVFQDAAYRILKNTKAYPHAFLAGNYVVEKNNQKILDTLFGKNFNPRNTVVLEKSLGQPIAQDQNATATITKYSPDSITIQTSSHSQNLLFLSDTFYPGWKAYVDGKETNIYRADYAFRCVVVPQGKHAVTFVYLPDSFVYGLSGTLSGIVFLTLFYYFQKRRV